MSSAALAAFAAALVVLLAALRYPLVLLFAVEALFFSIPFETFHGDWSVRGPVGALDVMDIFTAAMLAGCIQGTWAAVGSRKGDPAPRAADRRLRRLHGCAGGLVVTLLLVGTALGMGIEPTRLFSEARTPVMAIAVVWYGLLHVDSQERLSQLVWVALLSGVAGILVVSRQSFVDALAEGRRARAEAWLHTCYPAVVFSGWSLALLLRQRFSFRRSGAWLAVMAVYTGALAISQTRGYILGALVGLAVAWFLSGRYRYGLTAVAICVAGLMTLARGAEPAQTTERQADLAGAMGRAGERVQWDGSAETRREELELLFAQTEGVQWLFGRGLGGGFDARRVHPLLGDQARDLPFTHSGMFIPFLKLGLAGMVVAYASAWSFLRRLLRHLRSTDSPLAGGALAGLFAFLAANTGDPLYGPSSGFMLGFIALGGMLALSLDPRFATASPSLAPAPAEGARAPLAASRAGSALAAKLAPRARSRG